MAPITHIVLENFLIYLQIKWSERENSLSQFQKLKSVLQEKIFVEITKDVGMFRKQVVSMFSCILPVYKKFLVLCVLVRMCFPADQ